MATVKKCSVCGNAQIPDKFCKSCGNRVKEWLDLPAPEVSANSPPEEVPGSATANTWRCDRCDRENDAASTACADCFTPRGTTGVRVSCDGGELVIEANQCVLLGRNADPVAIGDWLARFDNVSREHLQLEVVDDGTTWATDHSVNGTWLRQPEGLQALPKGVRTSLTLPVTIQLGNDYHTQNASVRLEPTGFC